MILEAIALLKEEPSMYSEIMSSEILPPPPLGAPVGVPFTVLLLLLPIPLNASI